MIYVKDGNTCITHTKFIYRCSIYVCWRRGSALLDEKFYSCNKPLKLKKKDYYKKYKNYTIYRYFDLEFAPEEYLINNNYKLW